MEKDRRKNSVILCAGLSLYGFNRFTRVLSGLPRLAGVFFRNHFNDYLGAVVFISYVNLLLIEKDKPPCETVSGLLFWGSVCSFCWEWAAPRFLPNSTGDWLDCAAYYLGMLTYGGLIRLWNRKERK